MSALDVFQEAASVLRAAQDFPHGPIAAGDERKLAGEACVTLCAGDRDKARTLWKVVQGQLGYMPYAAACALIRAADTGNLVPDVEAPDPS